jgi:GT2 family glycosyltransferase
MSEPRAGPSDAGVTPATPGVSIVIPTLDAGDMLLGCLESFDAGREDVEVILVDNASTDDSVERARARYPSIRVVRNETNRGYAAACNIGVRHATAPFVLFLNNDATITPNDLDGLLAAARRDTGTAVWQPVTDGTDGRLESTGDAFTWWGVFRHLDVVPQAPSAEVFSTVGAAMLARRTSFEALGGFEDSYFAYNEETDLCWRARLAGHDVRVVRDAHVVHIGSETTGHLFEPHDVRYLVFRNRIRTNLANASRTTLVRLVPQHLLACLAFAVLYLVTARPRSSLAVLQAIAWPVGNRDVLADQRRRSQALRTRPDTDVLRPHLVARYGPRTIWNHLRRAYWFERASERARPRSDVSDSTRRN